MKHISYEIKPTTCISLFSSAKGGTVYFKQMAEANQMMSAGTLDVLINSAPCPLALMKELAATQDLKLLPIEEEIVEQLSEKYGYSKAIITKEDYDFVTTDQVSLGDISVIIVREGVPEEVVYKITKAIGDSLDYFYAADATLKILTHEFMYQVLDDIPLHPGAIRYYKEIGVMK